MGLKKTNGNGKQYVNVVQGKLRMTCEEGHENAVAREYETRDGEKKVKHELVFDSLEGGIESIEFVDTDFGKVCEVTIDGVVLQMNTSTKYFMNFSSKLPNVDMTKEVVIDPYDFKKEDKQYTGVSIYQEGAKMENYFRVDGKNLHGFPESENADSMDSDDWKAFFIGVKKFLIKYVEDNVKVETIFTPVEQVETDSPLSSKEKDITPEDLPW